MNTIHNITVGMISTNCWIYPLAGESGTCAVIDPGEEGGNIIAKLKHLNLHPLYIICTHGHFDHIGAVPNLVAEYGSPPVAIHAADAEYLGPDSYDAHCRSFRAAGGNLAYIDALWQDMPPADILLAEGDTIGPFTVLHVPGHTPGSIALWDTQAGVLFSGDTLFYDGFGRTDLPGGSEALLFASLKRLFTLDGSIQVYPGHGPATSIARESASNRF